MKLKQFSVFVVALSLITLVLADPPTPHAVSGTIYYPGNIQIEEGSFFKISDHDSGYKINGTTGKANLTGAYAVSIEGSDGDSVRLYAKTPTNYGETTFLLAASMFNVNLILNDQFPNTPPTITSSPVLEVTIGTTYEYNVIAVDNENNLDYMELETSPSGMYLDGTTVTWEPNIAGVFLVEVRVYDIFGEFDSQSYNLTVNPALTTTTTTTTLPLCTDTDSADSIYIQGTANVLSVQCTDSCYSGGQYDGQVLECYCETLHSVGEKPLACPSGELCNNGICTPAVCGNNDGICPEDYGTSCANPNCDPDCTNDESISSDFDGDTYSSCCTTPDNCVYSNYQCYAKDFEVCYSNSIFTCNGISNDWVEMTCPTNSNDPDGLDFESSGTCTDYTGCSGTTCDETDYDDYCNVDGILEEAITSGDTCSFSQKNCDDFETIDECWTSCNPSTGNIMTECNDWICSSGSCQDSASDYYDSIIESCSDQAIDTDGNDQDIFGTCTDFNLCTIGSSCPKIINDDSCSGDTLTEWYVSGNDCVSININCSITAFDNDGKSYGEASWCRDDTGCSGGKCTSSTKYDYCANNTTLTEYYVSGNACVTENYNCDLFETGTQCWETCNNDDIWQFCNDFVCSSSACTDSGSDIGVSVTESCQDTASDSDSGEDIWSQGTCIDKDFCTSGETSCPSQSFTDSCSSSILTEYYTNANDCVSNSYNCNDECISSGYDAGTCSAGACECSNDHCSSSKNHIDGNELSLGRYRHYYDSIWQWNDCGENTCTDSDTGNNPNVSGTVTDNNECQNGICVQDETYVDSCSSDSLTEYYCDSNNYQYQIYDCNAYCISIGHDIGNCESGACSCSDNCLLTSASLSHDCGNDGCSSSESITINGTLTGDCDTLTHFQIDAKDDSNSCSIYFGSSQIDGIFDTPTQNSNSISGSWQIPSIPDECKGLVINADDAGIYILGNPLTGQYVDGTNATGSFYFTECFADSDCTTYETGNECWSMCDASTGDIKTQCNDWQCSLGLCINSGSHIWKTAVETCVETASETDGGNIPSLFGSCTDSNLCSGNETHCPSNTTYYDSCSGIILTEYFVEGLSCNSENINCTNECDTTEIPYCTYGQCICVGADDHCSTEFTHNDGDDNSGRYRHYYLSGWLTEDCGTDTCTDSDNGDSPYVLGTVVDNNACTNAVCAPDNTYTDTCSGGFLLEYTCYNNDQLVVSHDCDETCIQDGFVSGICSSGLCVCFGDLYGTSTTTTTTTTTNPLLYKYPTGRNTSGSTIQIIKSSSSKSFTKSYILSGYLFLQDGQIQLPRGFEFSIVNTNTNQILNINTGAGPYPGKYLSSIQGNIGDIIEFRIANFTQQYKLIGDMEINIITDFTGSDFHFMNISAEDLLYANETDNFTLEPAQVYHNMPVKIIVTSSLIIIVVSMSILLIGRIKKDDDLDKEIKKLSDDFEKIKKI